MNEIKQLNIKNAEAYALAAELSALTGESLATVVTEALREKLEREAKVRDKRARLERLMELSRVSSGWPDRDGRTAEGIIGYDENGLPT